MVKPAKKKSSQRPVKSGPSRLIKRRLLMEGLEQRQLLAAGIGGGSTTGGNVNPGAIVDGDTRPANIGTVPAFLFSESEAPGEVGVNDGIPFAEFVPLGTRNEDEPIVDVSGTMSLIQPSGLEQVPEDVDYYRVSLRAGDILDIGTQGGIGGVDLFFEDGAYWFGTQLPTQSETSLPFNSPLQTVGDVLAAQVVPRTGDYYIRASTNGLSGAYTMGLRAYRPVMENQPIGSEQTVFIDFDGWVGSASELNRIDPETGLPITGTFRIDSLTDFLPNFGLEERDENELIDKILSRVDEDFNTVIPRNGTNGDFDHSGVPGEFGIRVLNSRDHADPLGQPNVTRVIVGGVNTDLGFEEGTLLGVASSLDIGNFDTSETVFSPLDAVVPYTDGIPFSGSVSALDLVAQTIAVTVSHELGHSFGLRHTDGFNNVGSMIDGPGPPVQAFDFELGPDGIFGTEDDENLEFPVRDRFSRVPDGEFDFFGFHYVADAIAYSLSTGTVGATVTGRIFSDLNADGVGTGEGGVPGVTVFLDANGNGLLDDDERRTTTSADGVYHLSDAPGDATVAYVLPDNFDTTTSTSETVTLGTTGTISDIDFGIRPIDTGSTGAVFADINGNGIRDAGEGIEGVFVYADLDGDDRPDIGEPRTRTAEDGTYTLQFPGAGNYTIRTSLGAGFESISPASGEQSVTFDGVNGVVNQNFIIRSSRDYGDAPAEYGTLAADGGPSHGIVPGLALGAVVDRELDGNPSSDATGDDVNGPLQSDGSVLDDEDGVRLLSPIGPGGTAEFEVTTLNDSAQPAFLQAWVDWNRDGDFDDAGEQIVRDLELATGTRVIDIDVPTTVTPGETFARFRYSHEAGLGPGGSTDTGEVEDYQFTIQPTAEIVNDDAFTVPRNSTGNTLDVLENDFQMPGSELTIVRLSGPTPRGSVQIAGDGQGLIYSPPNGFVGLDQFGYVVRTPSGQEFSGNVRVTVTFQTAVPIAVDDTYSVPLGISDRPLNVLDNDVSSINGGLSIASFSQGDAGGRVEAVGGGQSLLYTPAPNFGGTEQFSYVIVDSLGQSSMAEVTINVLPTAAADDLVDYSFEIRDAVDNRPIDTVAVGDEFLLTVLVDDLRPTLNSRNAVTSAFLDLLYTDELVSTVPVSGAVNGFPFDVSFGPLFTGSSGVFTLGDAATPGLLNEIGGTQPIGGETQHDGPTELFTVRLQAVAEGVATFQADPADLDVAETLLLDRDEEVPVSGLRLGNAELVIQADPGGIPTRAIDDSYPDARDSEGNLITVGGDAVLDVLDNDLLGASGTIVEFGILTSPGNGNVVIDDNGTPDNFNDDTLIYRSDATTAGVDRFRYLIVTADGFRSTAEVSVAVGAAAADDIVAIDFDFVDESGNPISQVNVGDRFGVQIIVDDLRGPLETSIQGVFAAFLDVLYDADLALPTNQDNSDFGFDVEFSSLFNSQAAVGVASTPGIINEFGTLQLDTQGTANPLGGEPTLMATLFFQAIAGGEFEVVGDKADFSPFQDTLLFDPADPVDPSQITYDIKSVFNGEALTITIPQGETARQNGVNPYDVNGDGYVSPIDALGVINTLNRMSRQGQGESNAGSQLFADVNGDDRITPVDALDVINYLSRNRGGVGAQGEAAPMVAGGASGVRLATDPFDPPETLGAPTERATGSGSNSSGEASRQAVFAAFDGEDDDREDEDVMDLLAGDVVDQWGRPKS